MTKKKEKAPLRITPKGPLAGCIMNPTQKIHWALRLLSEKGHSMGTRIEGEGGRTRYEIGSRMLTVQEIYALVTNYPEWNDRLGLGTARLPKVRT